MYNVSIAITSKLLFIICTNKRSQVNQPEGVYMLFNRKKKK